MKPEWYRVTRLALSGAAELAITISQSCKTEIWESHFSDTAKKKNRWCFGQDGN